MSRRIRFTALAAALALGALAPAAVTAQEGEPPSRSPEGGQELFERAYYTENGLKKPEEAEAIYRRAAALAGSDRGLEARALLRIASCERQRGRDLEAVEVLKKVLEKFPDLPEVKAEAETAMNDAGAARRVLRIYDIGMITEAHEDAPAPTLALRDPYGRRGFYGASGGVVLSGGEDVPAGVEISAERLVDLIRTNIAPDTWDGQRVRIDVEGTRLVIVQAPEIHPQIEAYLKQLRAVRGRVVTLEATLAVVDGELVGDAVTGALLSTTQTAALEAAIRGGAGARLISRPRATVFNGHKTALTTLRSRTFLGDYDVNQTGVTPTINPQVETAREGLVFTARPTLVEDGRSVLLQIQLEGSAWRGSRKQQTSYGTIDLPEMGVAAVETSLVAPSGATVVAAIVSATYFDPGAPAGIKPGAGGRRLVLTVRPTISALAPEGEAGPSSRVKRPLRTYNVALLTQRLEPEWTWALVHEPGGVGFAELEATAGSETWGAPLGEEALLGLIRENIAPDSWTNLLNSIQFVSAGTGELVVIQTPDVHDQVRAYLATLRGERALLLQAQVFSFGLDEAACRRVVGAIRDGGADANTLSSSELDDLVAGRVPGATLLREAGGSIVNGQRLHLGEGRTQRYVREYERCSGGTGNAVSEVADPVVAQVAEGCELDLRAKVVPGGRLAMVGVTLDVSRLEEMDTAKTPDGNVDLPSTVAERPSLKVTFPIDRVLVVSLGQGVPGVQERTITLLRLRPVDVFEKR